MAPIRSLAARRRADTYPPTVREELQDLEARLGGRDQIVGLLALAPLTPDLRYILGLLGDPGKQAIPLADLCALAGILPGDLLTQLAAAALLKGKVQAQQQIGAGVASVAADVMRRAAPYEETCGGCRGTGSVTPEPTPAAPNPQPGPCETCWGSGKLRYLPDLDRQKLALDLAQLLPKGGGLSIVNANVQGGAGSPAAPGSYEALQALTDALLYGAPPIDAEIAEVGEVEIAGVDPPVDDPAAPA